MTPGEFADLQDALVYVFAPWVVVLSGGFVGASVITAVFLMFARLVKWLTRTG